MDWLDLLLTAIKVAANAIRSLIMVIVQNALHFQIGARLFRHLIRLPIAYFEKRHIGDVLSRFTSIEPIRGARSRRAQSRLEARAERPIILPLQRLRPVQLKGASWRKT